MAQLSAIEWTEATWNPLTGCMKISPGCKNCYAERMARRLQAMGQPNYAKGFALTLHERMLDAPLRWRKPRRVFVNSMSDLFQDGVPVDFIKKVFAVMGGAAHHQFQILTKRSERLFVLNELLEWMPNIWMGVSVESRKYTFRIDHLRQTGARIKFLSLEPLLAPLGKLDLSGIDWVIVGGESGPRARPMDPAWARKFAISASPPTFRSSSNSGAESGRVGQGDCWMGAPGTGFRALRKQNPPSARAGSRCPRHR